MPSIALFFSTFAHEKEITDKLSSSLGLDVVNDEAILHDVSSKKQIPINKLEQCLYHKTSVFNQFTLEKERNAAFIKSALAERLDQGKNVIYQGFITLLIPHDVTHVLKVLVVDNKEERMRRATAKGISEKDAAHMIHASDQKAYEWTDFLFQKEAYDKSLYDIVIPIGESSADDVVGLIKENCKKIAVLETESSQQAVKDFALSAQVEHALLLKGQKVEVETRDSRVFLKVNKSTFSFSKLTEKLSSIAHTVQGVKEVEVLQGKGYRTSVYRDQQFELPPKVLLVDDEREYVQTLSERLVNRNVGSYAVFDGQQALDLIDDDKPDVMVLDLKMPGINGIEVLTQTKRKNPKIEVIILTGHGSEADRKTCMELGAFAYLQKPADIEKLSGTISAAYTKIALSNAMGH